MDDERYLVGVKNWELTVFASNRKLGADIELKIANWTRDDIIEYLVSKSPQRCKSVMARINESNDLWLGNGSPRVLSTVVEDADFYLVDLRGAKYDKQQEIHFRRCGAILKD